MHKIRQTPQVKAVVDSIKGRMKQKGVVDVETDADPQDNTTSDTYSFEELLAVVSRLLCDGGRDAAITMYVACLLPTCHLPFVP